MPISGIRSTSASVSARTDPIVAVAGEHHGGDAVLLQDDVALNGWRCLIFPQLLDPVGTRRAGAEHLEDDDGLRARSCRPVGPACSSRTHRIADAALHLDLAVRPPGPARLAAQPLMQQRAQRAADRLVPRASRRSSRPAGTRRTRSAVPAAPPSPGTPPSVIGFCSATLMTRNPSTHVARARPSLPAPPPRSRSRAPPKRTTQAHCHEAAGEPDPRRTGHRARRPSLDRAQAADHHPRQGRRLHPGGNARPQVRQQDQRALAHRRHRRAADDRGEGVHLLLHRRHQPGADGPGELRGDPHPARPAGRCGAVPAGQHARDGRPGGGRSGRHPPAADRRAGGGRGRSGGEGPDRRLVVQAGASCPTA